MIELYDEVLLKTGETAIIVEILEQDVMYIGEVNLANQDISIDFVSAEEISKLLKKWQPPPTEQLQ